MFFDKQNLFAEDQALGDSGASTNVVDMGSLGSKVNDPNIRTEAFLHVQVTTAFTDCTSLIVTLQSDSTEDFSSGAVVTELTSATVLLADLVAGKKLFGGTRLPDGMGRYLRLYYTIAGSTETAGTIFAGLTLDNPTAV